MKNLIYQYWDGNIRPSVRAGVDNMKAYAEKVGAEYLFEENPNWIKSLGMNFGNYSAHYGAFKPLWNKKYRDYDNIIFCDTDVFSVDSCTDNIFEEFNADIGICEESFQPKQRTITLGRITTAQDELWAKTIQEAYGKEVPRTEEGLVKVYNSGVVIYSAAGAEHARNKWDRFKNYVNLIKRTNLDSFYTCDQPYLHAMIFVTDMNVQILNNKWNSYIHGTIDKNHDGRYIVDHRTSESCFVHCQFPGADDMTAEQLNRVVNLSSDKWEYDRFKVVKYEN